MFRNQIGAPPCLPCKPIAPLVGWELRGLFNQGGIFEPSGFSVPDLQRVISKEVTGWPFRTTSIFGPQQVIWQWFHSPAGFAALWDGANRPKIAPHFHLESAFTHFGPASSSNWISTEFDTHCDLSEA